MAIGGGSVWLRTLLGWMPASEDSPETADSRLSRRILLPSGAAGVVSGDCGARNRRIDILSRSEAGGVMAGS